MLGALIVIALAVAVLVVGIGQFNRLRALTVRVAEALGQVDVQLQRRADLIPNLVETVKGYAAHESGVLEAVTAARARLQQASESGSVADRAAADAALSQALVSVNAVAEAYPDLKASSNFAQLSEELTATENKVAFARQYYNDSVASLNTAVSTFPGLLLTGVAGASKAEFYEVADPAARTAPRVQF